MSKELGILDAAHAIRSHLRELLSDTEAETFERELDALLKKAESDEDTEEKIASLLEKYETTREWTDKFLNTDETRFSPLPGIPSASVAGGERYTCPGDRENCDVFGCDYKTEDWDRMGSEDVPLCPETHTPLKRAE